MISIRKQAAPLEPARGESYSDPPTPFNVRGEGQQTEHNDTKMYTQSLHTPLPAQFNDCICQASYCSNVDVPNYLYSPVKNIPIISSFTDSTHTHDREQKC